MIELPQYVRRPLDAAGQAGLYRDASLVGYVAPTWLAWFATFDSEGEIVDSAAREISADDYHAWAARLKAEAERRGAALFECVLDDATFSLAMASQRRLN